MSTTRESVRPKIGGHIQVGDEGHQGYGHIEKLLYPFDVLASFIETVFPNMQKYATTAGIVIVCYLAHARMSSTYPTDGVVSVVADVHTTIVVSAAITTFFFSVSPFYALFWERATKKGKHVGIYSRSHVGFLCICGVTFACMATHIYIAAIGQIHTLNTLSGSRILYTTYYCEWITTTPMMIQSLFHFAETTKRRRIVVIRAQILNFLMFTSGSWLWGEPTLLKVVINAYFFIGNLYSQDRLLKFSKMVSKDESIQSEWDTYNSNLRIYYTMTWMLFPMIYVLGTLEIIQPWMEIKLFAYADLSAKVGLVNMAYRYINNATDEVAWCKKILEQERLKSDVVRYIFHETRVPLNTISLGVSNLDVSDDAKEIESVKKTLAASCDSMRHILDDYLVWEKMRAGKISKFKFEVATFALQEIVDMLLTRFKATAEKNDLTYTVEARVKNTSFIGDKYKIVQIASNYISNAMKFTPRGGIVSFVVEEVQPPPNSSYRPSNLHSSIRDALKEGDICWLQFSCRDTGAGISEENQKLLFTPFVQIEPGVKKNSSGAGLGLSICKEMAAGMGGSVHLESMIGKGATFYVTLPLPKAISRKDIPDGPLQATIGDGNKLSDEAPLRVLITDDVKSNREFLAKRLRRMKKENGKPKYVCDVAEDGVAAIRMSQNKGPFPYDVYLMDNQMPNLLGRDCIRKLRDEHGIKSMMIGVTGDVISEDRKLMLECGADCIHGKPVNVKALTQDISEFFEKKRNASRSQSSG